MFLVSILLVPVSGLFLVLILLAWFLSCPRLVILILFHAPHLVFLVRFHAPCLVSLVLLQAQCLALSLFCHYCCIQLPTTDYFGGCNLVIAKSLKVKIWNPLDSAHQSNQHKTGGSLIIHYLIKKSVTDSKRKHLSSA